MNQELSSVESVWLSTGVSWIHSWVCFHYCRIEPKELSWLVRSSWKNPIWIELVKVVCESDRVEIRKVVNLSRSAILLAWVFFTATMCWICLSLGVNGSRPTFEVCLILFPVTAYVPFVYSAYIAFEINSSINWEFE